MRAGRAVASVYPPDPARAACENFRSRGREPMSEPEAPAAAMRGDRETPEISRLKRRADFQRAARGRRARMDAFALQANGRATAPDGAGPRVGFTVTKKLGGAVVRNRIRRRLKEAVRLSSNLETRLDHDYVLMAQREALLRPFALLRSDVIRAFYLIHSSASRSAPARQSNDRDKRR
jgi:ribonuclease P protein component